MYKNDKLIAEFMGLEIITDGISWFDTSFKSLKKYKVSWDSLMPVIEKILDITFNDDEQETYDSDMFYEIRDCIPDLSQTYKAVLNFINKYNNNKNGKNV